MRKFRAIMSLITLALVGRIMLSFVISRTTLGDAVYDAEFHHYFDTPLNHPLPEKRSFEYCNFPGYDINGAEGVPPAPDMKLIGAALLVRHGDRLPISRPPSFQKSPPPSPGPCKLDPTFHPRNHLLEGFISNVSSHTEEIRNSGSALLHEFDLLADTCSSISITQTGIVQMLELGQFLGKRYLDQRQRESGNDQHVDISTSRFARTYQSLLALLYGLSPNRFMELIDGKIGSSSTIYFCDSDLPADPAFSTHCDCPKAKSIPKLRATFRDWDISQPSISYLYRVLNIDKDRTSSTKTSKIGAPLLSLTSPSRVWDWLVSEYYCPGRPLPCVPGSATECLNSSLIEDLIHLVDRNHLRMVNDKKYVEAASLAMYPFLKSVNKKFHQLVKERKRNAGVSSPYVWVLSGHDISIGPLFIALKLPLLTKVPYASRVAIELWTKCDKNDKCNVSKPQVRVLLNGDDITRKLGFCKTFKGSGTLCPLSLFDKYVHLDFFNSLNIASYDEACGS